MTEVNTGGWIDVYEPNNATEYYPDRVYYAVERVGASLAHDRLLPGKHSAQGNTRDTEYERPAAAWADRCRAAPVEAAKALVACFRSFVEGGFLMEDLDGHQFTFVEATGHVYAIDAPEPLATSPIYDVLDWLTKRGARGENSAAACAAGQDQQSCVWSAWCVTRVPFSRLRDPTAEPTSEPPKTPSTRLYAIDAIHLHTGRGDTPARPIGCVQARWTFFGAPSATASPGSTRARARRGAGAAGGTAPASTRGRILLTWRRGRGRCR